MSDQVSAVRARVEQALYDAANPNDRDCDVDEGRLIWNTPIRNLADAVMPIVEAALRAVPLSDETQALREALICNDGQPHFCGKCDSYVEPAPAVSREAEGAQAYEYLSRLLTTLWPHITPLPTLLGVCTQIDNGMVDLRERALASSAAGARPETEERP
jgi:hypothetical protein